jgi:lipopolysaccharide assembly outer membrane protein LptD (OstA)
VVRNPRTSFYAKEGEKVTVTGAQGNVQFDGGGKDLQRATLHENVEIHVRGFIVRANDAVYDKATEQILAKGAVTIDGDQLRVAGSDMVVFVKESRFALDKPVRVTLQPKGFEPARPS